MSPERSIRIGRNRYLVESDDEYLTRMGPEFEPHTIALLNAFVDSSSVVADVGANIGLTTLFLAEKARKVVAFEPSPSTFEILERNVRRSGASKSPRTKHNYVFETRPFRGIRVKLGAP